MSAIIWAGAMLATTGIICLAALRAWREWIDLRRHEIGQRREEEVPDPSFGVRIEMANLKERLRKLEAIARGVDL
jgi:hypothetical protein